MGGKPSDKKRKNLWNSDWKTVVLYFRPRVSMSIPRSCAERLLRTLPEAASSILSCWRNARKAVGIRYAGGGITRSTAPCSASAR